MAAVTTSLLPNGNSVNGPRAWSAQDFQNIDEGNASPDGLVVTSVANPSNNDTSFLLGATPADFATAGQTSIALRASTTVVDDEMRLYSRVVKESDGTVLAAADSAGTFQETGNKVGGTDTFTGLRTYTFAYTNAAATKADWDDARLEFRATYAAVKGADGGTVSVDSVEVKVLYESPWTDVNDARPWSYGHHRLVSYGGSLWTVFKHSTGTTFAVWKTGDEGATWTLAGGEQTYGDGLSGMSVRQDPTDASKLHFMLTGQSAGPNGPQYFRFDMDTATYDVSHETVGNIDDWFLGVDFDFRSNGDIVAFWSANASNVGEGYYAIRSASTGIWTAPAIAHGDWRHDVAARTGANDRVHAIGIENLDLEYRIITVLSDGTRTNGPLDPDVRSDEKWALLDRYVDGSGNTIMVAGLWLFRSDQPRVNRFTSTDNPTWGTYELAGDYSLYQDGAVANFREYGLVCDGPVVHAAFVYDNDQFIYRERSTAVNDWQTDAIALQESGTTQIYLTLVGPTVYLLRYNNTATAWSILSWPSSNDGTTRTTGTDTAQSDIVVLPDRDISSANIVKSGDSYWGSLNTGSADYLWFPATTATGHVALAHDFIGIPPNKAAVVDLLIDIEGSETAGGEDPPASHPATVDWYCQVFCNATGEALTSRFLVGRWEWLQTAAATWLSAAGGSILVSNPRWKWADAYAKLDFESNANGVSGKNWYVTVLDITVRTGAAVTSKLFRWDGSAWVTETVKYWDGTVWTTKPMRRWDGTSWVPVT